MNENVSTNVRCFEYSASNKKSMVFLYNAVTNIYNATIFVSNVKNITAILT